MLVDHRAVAVIGRVERDLGAVRAIGEMLGEVWRCQEPPKAIFAQLTSGSADGAVALTHSTGATTSASLIGRLGSSTFRLSAVAVSMSLAGACFSSESAPRPFHHGIRRRGGTIFTAALPSDEQQVQAEVRTHLIHRPARDIISPLGGIRVFLLSHLVSNRPSCRCDVPGPAKLGAVNPDAMQCIITANRRASATIAFFTPRRLAICIAQALSQDHFFDHSML